MNKFITINNSIYTDKTSPIEVAAGNVNVIGHQLVTDRMVRLGIKSAPEVLVDSVCEDYIEDLKRSVGKPGKAGLFYASGNSFGEQGAATPINFRTVPNQVSNIMIRRTANKMGPFDHVSTDSTSCCSGHMSLKIASLMIDAGEIDRALVISAEDGLSYANMFFFDKYNICETETRKGYFRIGQSANFLLLENEKSIEQTKNKKTAQLIDVRIASEDHDSVLGISASGEGYRKVIEKQISTPDIIKMHGTGTPDNEIENKIISELYPDSQTISYKGDIGHTLGSAANTEMCMAMNSMSGCILSISSGMGNVFSSTLIKTTKE